ncbi:MAG: hypothetical protein R3202_01835 [Candidatus Competibacterales bacterium]|nr:hypothetical protein [Candidatus Competibacterales bacterium]
MAGLLQRLFVIAGVVVAYGLLYGLWVISREFAHTYRHWLEGLNLLDLPVPTTYALPLIGIDGGNFGAAVAAGSFWLVALLWPGFLLLCYLRDQTPNRAAILALGLCVWLMLVLLVLAMTATGLWLPFSLI